MSTSPLFDPAEIRRALDVLILPHAVFEVRILGPQRGRGYTPPTIFGFFDDPAKVPEALAGLTLTAAKGVYVTLNPIDPALLARAHNRFCESKDAPASADKDIPRRRWMLIDLDPKRPAGISASDTEKAVAHTKARAVYRHLKDAGWPEPVIADSGNGFHLLYRIDEPAECPMVKECLENLACRFDGDGVHVDATVFNPARIGKLYGTLAGKGDHAPDLGRPHRMSRLLHVPEAIQPVSTNLLLALAAETQERRETPTPQDRSWHHGNGRGWDKDRMQRFIDEHLTSYSPSAPIAYDGGYKWVLSVCPFNNEHTNRSAVVVLKGDGKLGFQCHHNSCAANDWNRLRGMFEPKRSQESNEVTGELHRLAGLGRIEYDREREAAAQRLGVRVGVLDAEVAGLRASSHGEAGPAPWVASLLSGGEPTPWKEPVDGAELLNNIVAVLSRYAVFPNHAAEALALFVLTTYSAAQFDAAPYVHLTSPTKRCGKSLVTRLLASLCYRALPAGHCTEAALFRAIDAATPTLLIDETDAFFAEHPEMRGMLNAGNVRDEAFVLRAEESNGTGGKGFEVRRYSVFCAKAFAGIGKLGGKESRLWETLGDRCITIPMRRKRPDERREKFRRRAFSPEVLRQQCRRWADDAAETLKVAEPSIPEALNDRAGDLWEPLLAVADLVGGEWPIKARETAVALSGENPDAEPATDGAMMLCDIKGVFEATGADRMFSFAICAALNGMEGRPYGDERHGKGLNPNSLAETLAPFGVFPSKIRLAGEPKPRQGYRVSDFVESWSRYLPSEPKPLSDRNTGTKPANIGDSALFELEQTGACSTPRNTIPTNEIKGCSGVPVQTPQTPGEEQKEALLL